MIQCTAPVFKLKFDSSTTQGVKKRRLNIAYSQSSSHAGFPFSAFYVKKNIVGNFSLTRVFLHLFFLVSLTKLRPTHTVSTIDY